MFTCDDQRVVYQFLDLIVDLKESRDDYSHSILEGIVSQLRILIGDQIVDSSKS